MLIHFSEDLTNQSGSLFPFKVRDYSTTLKRNPRCFRGEQTEKFTKCDVIHAYISKFAPFPAPSEAPNFKFPPYLIIWASREYQSSSTKYRELNLLFYNCRHFSVQWLRSQFSTDWSVSSLSFDAFSGLIWISVWGNWRDSAASIKLIGNS